MCVRMATKGLERLALVSELSTSNTVQTTQRNEVYYALSTQVKKVKAKNRFSFKLI